MKTNLNQTTRLRFTGLLGTMMVTCLLYACTGADKKEVATQDTLANFKQIVEDCKLAINNY